MEHEKDESKLHKARLRQKYAIRDVSEDVYFWKLVRKRTDYKILIDPKIQCGHISDLEVTHSIFKNFYESKMEMVKAENPEEYKQIMELICRAEAIKSAS